MNIRTTTTKASQNRKKSLVINEYEYVFMSFHECGRYQTKKKIH